MDDRPDFRTSTLQPILDRSSKLGDFTRIRPQYYEEEASDQSRDASVTVASLGPDPLPTPAASEGPTQLGDFFRLFARLEAETAALNVATRTEAVTTWSRDVHIRVRTKAKVGTPSMTDTASCKSSTPPYVQSVTDSLLATPPACDIGCDRSRGCPLSPNLGLLADSALDSSNLTGPHSASEESAVPPPKCSFEKHESWRKTSRYTRHAPSRQRVGGSSVSYKILRRGSPNSTLDFLPLFPPQNSDRLSFDLSSLCVADQLRAAQYPNVGSNGIHVFLDMSNIHINFQQTLRAKYPSHDLAHVLPLPPLDLHVLTEILVRGRRTVALNAGCSVSPGRHEPRYIRELRRHGYQVDLRERKRVLAELIGLPPHGKQGTRASSSDEMSTGAASARFVEELVDETLQTRIAESVMEYFQKQGTLVLATGDAQPAKYSDGFLTYAERALKMGWNVEVVSWRRSLSSHWTNNEWVSRWGNRFRVVELDRFVDKLLARHA
ncbi:hypothetical protein CDD83_5451 [Cordyceps sp. RAO-2017]|nr:hypothetical protein CDD83_5451 [Cordyceps sp. RAO-2017]